MWSKLSLIFSIFSFSPTVRSLLMVVVVLALLPIAINFAHSKLMYNFSSPCTVEDSTQVLRGIFFFLHILLSG